MSHLEWHELSKNGNCCYKIYFFSTLVQTIRLVHTDEECQILIKSQTLNVAIILLVVVCSKWSLNYFAI